MNRAYILLVITVLFMLPIKSVHSQSVTIDGHAFLEFEEFHEGIKVKIERVAPYYISDSTYTDQTGYYIIDLEVGIYTINFSKPEYISLLLPSMPLYKDSSLVNQTIETLGFSGALSGQISAGIYKVGADIYVPENETLIIKPGAILKFKEDTKFEIFGKLLANGTHEDSIKFTTYQDGLSWKGIDFKENSSEFSSLTHCIVEYSNDRGISVFKCHPSIQYSLIQNNSHYTNVDGQDEHKGGGAGICLKYSNSILKNITVKDNSGETLGCGIYCSDGKPHIINSLIINNSNPMTMYGQRPGGGIQCSYNVELTIENSVLCYNLNTFGGGICVGPGIASYHPNATIVNCIFYENSAQGEYSHGGGVNVFNKASASIINSLLWNNEGGNYSGDDIWLGVDVTTNNNLDSCDAYGNIQIDPLFTSPSMGDFSIMEESPCIDAGDNSYVSIKIDFIDNYRIWDGNNDGDSIVDIGAYEFDSQYNSSGDQISDNRILSPITVYPNPAKSIINIDSEEFIKVEIYSTSGVKVLSSNQYSINVSNLKSGIYILVFTLANKKNYVEKIIIL